ncbi:MAG: glycosyltransferase family 4 protein [Solirubrobacterales bacterium]|nr:glycosyltransferase family 4 protein [Solirubrobacterales bacterium]
MSDLRLGVYCDFSYRVVDGAVFAELPFIRFVEGLAPHCARLVVLGRLDPGAGEVEFPFALRGAEFVGLPYYRSGADLASVLRTVPVALWRFWRALAGLDVVWVLGPNPPQALLFALLGRLRRRRVVLGVRQDLPELIRHRRPGQRLVLAAAQVLETAFRGLARRLPVVVVGPELARKYRRSPVLLDAYVSLLSADDLLDPAHDDRRYDAEALAMLSVGRLDPEKNPLLMADVLHRALQSDPRWRLEVCGDGTLAQALRERAAELGVADRLLLHGYVPVDRGLWDFYRRSHALLHVSMTEGVPQVILEAFASRLPVVATDVGGVGDLVRDRGLLAAAGDADTAAEGLGRLVGDDALRRRCVEAAFAAAADHTLAAECARLAGFLSMNS